MTAPGGLAVWTSAESSYRPGWCCPRPGSCPAPHPWRKAASAIRGGLPSGRRTHWLVLRACPDERLPTISHRTGQEADFSLVRASSATGKRRSGFWRLASSLPAQEASGTGGLAPIAASNLLAASLQPAPILPARACRCLRHVVGPWCRWLQPRRSSWPCALLRCRPEPSARHGRLQIVRREPKMISFIWTSIGARSLQPTMRTKEPSGTPPRAFVKAAYPLEAFSWRR